MNRIEELKRMKRMAAEKQRKARLRKSLTGSSRSSGGISPNAAKAIAAALSGLLHSA